MASHRNNPATLRVYEYELYLIPRNNGSPKELVNNSPMMALKFDLKTQNTLFRLQLLYL